MLRSLVSALALLAALPAAGQDLATTQSWEHGSWRTATMVNETDGRRFCAAETSSLFDQVLRIALYETGDAFLEIRDVTWAYPNGIPMRFHLIVGSQERIVTGQGWEGSISLDLLDDSQRVAVLDRLTRGEGLDLRLPNRSRIAQFSLDGADAAIEAAKSCWEAIRAGGDYQP